MNEKLVQRIYNGILRPEFKIVIIYLSLGCVWILVSDHFLRVLVKERAEEDAMQTFKGLVYVGTTSIHLYFLIKRFYKKQRDQVIELQAQNKKLRGIAWIQSHMMRAPLARMMGSIHLLQDNSNPAGGEHDILYQAVLNSANELDALIRSITEKAESESAMLNKRRS